jgi:hypothetical protein
MGKDREGVFHPKKGKPSDDRDEGLGLRPTLPPEKFDEDMEMTDKYTSGPDELAENVHLLHPNRNTNKKRDLPKNASQNPSDKAINETFNEDIVDTVPEELPGLITKEMLAELAGFEGPFCISIYIPTHKSGVQVNEQHDIITFKNAVQKVEKRLAEKGIATPVIQRTLKPAYDLLSDDDFWHNLNESLAVFVSDGYFRYSRLPFRCAEETIVNSSFHLGTLVEGIQKEKYFYFLVMSKKQVKFYRADANGMERIEVPELPNGVDDVVHFENKDDQKLWRTGGRGGTGGANFHGIGAGKPDEKTHIGLYLEEVDDTLWKEMLNKETVPLLIAGIEYMIPIYRQVSDYKHLWPEAVVRGALEHEDEDTLYKMAMEKMQPYFNKEYDQAKADYFNKSATDLTSSSPSVVIPAAYYGRIENLFVVKDARIWGSFDEQNNQLRLMNEQTGDNECQVNKAIIKTLLNGGNVFLTQKEQMPDESVLAAVFRY